MIAVEYKIETVGCIDGAVSAENVATDRIVAVTQVVTNSTTGIGTVKLLSATKCKIICTGHEVVYVGVEV